MRDAAMVAPLTAEQRAAALSELRSWHYDAERKAFSRTITLRNFSEAFGLMTRIALEAEKADHHPDWSNVYSRLEIRLTTHDAGDVSDRDIRLAKVIDELVSEDGR
jgi:4a-hydroxytetrahydrobiopterin dehydratase